MTELFSTMVARVRGLFRPGAGDADFAEEMDAHLAMAEEEKIRRGLSPEQARRAARLELGGVTQVRDAARAARGLPWIDAFWLDGKLGLRMLRKSWGLTLVGGLAMAVTIGLGASMFTIWTAFAGTSLPLDEGDRVVAIQPFDRASQQVDRATPLADFRRWRDGLRSVEQVSAMRPSEPAIITRGGPTGSVPAAEMTASAFRLTRVQPLLGRTLIEQDEREGADAVAVIGYGLWQSAFSSDAAVIGQRIQIGDTPHTIVGVMPDGFRFPINQRLWTAMRTDRAGDAAQEGVAPLFVFARLAPAATLEGAQAEVETLGLLPRDKAGQTTADLQLRVVPYVAGIFPDVHGNSWLGGVIVFVGVLLLVPPCANIAILVYARTVTRRDEFATRAALGASRSRIVMQVFVEVLVLAALAGVAGFLLARQFAARLPAIVMPGMGPGRVPFWMDFTPSLPTVLCVAGLSVIAAAIAGAVPAFHATGGWQRSQPGRLDQRGDGAGAGLGKTWTALLAMQVALSLAILPSGIEMTWGIFKPTIVGPSLPVKEFLTGQLAMEGDTARFGSLATEAVRRLSSEAGVSGVTTSAALLMEEPGTNIEVEGIEAPGEQAWFNSVDDKYFDVFRARFLAGRGFESRDFGPAPNAVIVNRTFVEEILDNSNALGRRVRYIDRKETAKPAGPSAWYDIVGVVDDFPGNNDGPVVYHPLARPVHPLYLTIRVSTDMALAASRLREVSTALDSSLRVGRIRSLEDVYWGRCPCHRRLGLCWSL
jgi:predicted permease